jgi:hypothetical protein
MLDKPITEAGKLIGANWYKSPSELSAASGVPMHWISAALHGNDIPEVWMNELKRFFKTL